MITEKDRLLNIRKERIKEVLNFLDTLFCYHLIIVSISDLRDGGLISVLPLNA